MPYYICYKPCMKSEGRRVYYYRYGRYRPTLGPLLKPYWIILNEQEREIYRDYMVKEGYNYEDC